MSHLMMSFEPSTATFPTTTKAPTPSDREATSVHPVQPSLIGGIDEQRFLSRAGISDC